MLRTVSITYSFIFFHFIIITQAEISLVMTDIDTYFNPKYFDKEYEIFLLDEGIDNQLFINFTVIELIPVESTAHFKMMGATMGEYKINTGFEFQCGACDLENEPILFGRIIQKVGMEHCPCDLGNYKSDAFEIDLSTLPDTFFPNKYVLDLWLDTDDGEERMVSIQLYFTVQ